MQHIKVKMNRFRFGFVGLSVRVLAFWLLFSVSVLTKSAVPARHGHGHHRNTAQLIFGAGQRLRQKQKGGEGIYKQLKKSQPRPLSLRGARPPTTCRHGLDLLLSDIGLVSILLSAASLDIAAVSLALSNFFNVAGAVPSLAFVGLPSLVLNVLSLFNIFLPANDPIVIFLTYASILDSLNNLFSIVPGSLLSDLIGVVSLVLGKVSFAMGKVVSYPHKYVRALEKVGLRGLIDASYGCGQVTPSKLLEDVIEKVFGRIDL